MFFTIFWRAFFALDPAMEEQRNEPLQPHFEAKAAPPQERVTVSLDLDADVLGWLKEQPTDWQRELNNLARFSWKPVRLEKRNMPRTHGNRAKCRSRPAPRPENLGS